MTDIAENLIQSKVKRKLLKLFLFNKNKKYHTRELSRVIDEPISAVQREVKKLVNLQIIFRVEEGNLVNYFLNDQAPFFKDLKSIILKITTEPKDFFKLLIKTQSLNFVAICGDIVKKPMDFSIPIKLLIVGTLDKDLLNEYLKAIMDIFNRDYELEYVSVEEFTKKKESDPLFAKMLTGRQIKVLKDTLN